MILMVLWLLATIDAAFIGYREAAGRNALIDKRAYYRRAMLRGALFGQIAVLIAAIYIGIALFFSAEPRVLIDDLTNAGARMLMIYVPFALVIFAAFALRLLPSVDIKSITSTVIFGPFTLLRPFVAVVGIIYGFLVTPKPLIIAFGSLVLTMMLSLELIIGRLRARNFIS